jgi:maltose alpha-D-glucosyltransferase/alpha-amylase
VLKIYRQLQPCLNPEIEIGQHLSRQGYTNTPQYLGATEMDIGGERHAVAVLHRFIRNQGDGWALTAGYLDRFLEERRLMPETPPDGQHETYMGRMTEIGIRLAQLHKALGEDGGDPAFQPEPMTEADLRAECERMRAKARRLLDGLGFARKSVPNKAKPLVEAILDRGSRIAERLEQIMPRQPLPFKSRYHGDFHLGQVMIVQGDVFILDFEGEPQRPISERREKGVPLRDVAGQLRSLDYAGLSAVERLLQTLPDGNDGLGAAVANWRRLATAAFLDAYQGEMAGHRLWPKDDAAHDWLHFLQADKVIYEIGYEMANRPGWLHLPLIGFWDLLFDGEAAPI